MSRLRLTYLVLAVLGALLPAGLIARHLAATGADLPAVVALWTANGAALGVLGNLFIAGLAFSVFIAAETWARRDFPVLLCIPVIFVVGLSCGLPLYLFLRSRPVR